MAIDGIGGVGALNVSSNVKATKPEHKVQTTATGAGAGGGQIKVQNLPPVAAKSNSDNRGQNERGQDPAGLQSEQNVSAEQARAAVEDLNKQVKQANPIRHTQLSFKYHDDTNRISITVTDSDTDEVIREIPPEKALDMLAKAWELAGLMVDEKR